MSASESVPGFEWFPGIPARNSWCYGHAGDVPVKVTHLTVLRFVLIEEIDPTTRLPVRTLMNVDLDGVDRPNLTRFLAMLGVRP